MKGKLSKVSRVVSISLACLMSNSLAWADLLDIRADAPSQYTIKKGDTLWDISELYLESPWRWPEIWQANSYIQNPHLIYPGDLLTLKWKDGVPSLELTRKADIKEPIPTLLTDDNLRLIGQSRLISEQELVQANRIKAGFEPRHFFSQGDMVWLEKPMPDSRYGVYRKISSHQRADTEANITLLKQVATAELTKHANNDGTQLEIKHNTLEVRVGDLVLPLVFVNDESIQPSPAPQALTAKILGNMANSHYSYEQSMVLLDKGQTDGVEVGQVFTVKAPDSKGEAHFPVQGSAVILKNYHQFSIAKLTDSRTPIANQSILISPENK